MPHDAHRSDNLHQLRTFVRQTICDREQLVPDAYPMTETVLTRGHTPCGRYFCLHGPRATKYSAIWVSERKQVLFYDAAGERYLAADYGEICSGELQAAAT